MNDHRDEGDWSRDAASLFREARRAHDPTLAESARLAAVLERIQSGRAEAAFTMNRGADIVARMAASRMLRVVAGASLGAVCIAAAWFALTRVDARSSEPTRAAKPAAIVPSSTPPLRAVPPAPVPVRELGVSAEAPAVRDEAGARPRSRSPRRRTHVSGEPLPSERIEAPVPEQGSSGGSEPGTTETNGAVRQETVERATAVEPRPRETVTANAREADQALPQQARTELAMMKRIQAALRDANFAQALRLCAEHAERWPHGVFELEREGVRAIASCGGGSDDAALRAKRFLVAHPHAAVAMRVSSACAAQLINR